MKWLIRIVSWRSKSPPVIRWLAAFALYGIALGVRFAFGRLHGGIPSLTFYPALLIATVFLGWKEAAAVLVLSIATAMYLFLPPEDYLQPIGWAIVGGMTIPTITGLQVLAFELINANERQRVLFQELQHRVANTLQSVIGPLEIARMRIDTAPAKAKKILEDTVLRVSASADVHRRLHDPNLFLAGLPAILRDAVATIIDSSEVDVCFDIEPLALSFDQMSVIALMVIEIANNAQKHVFLPDLGRRFLVSLHVLGNRALLSVRDDGPNWALEVSTERSLGLTILHNLARQLGGDLSITSKNGTEVRVSFAYVPIPA